MPAENFRGFRPDIYSPISGITTHDYGDVSGSDVFDHCFSVPIDEEIMYFTVFSDINDVEGILFEGHLGTEYSFRANGQ